MLNFFRIKLAFLGSFIIIYPILLIIRRRSQIMVFNEGKGPPFWINFQSLLWKILAFPTIFYCFLRFDVFYYFIQVNRIVYLFFIVGLFGHFLEHEAGFFLFLDIWYVFFVFRRKRQITFIFLYFYLFLHLVVFDGK